MVADGRGFCFFAVRNYGVMRHIADRLNTIVGEVDPRLRAFSDLEAGVRPASTAWSKKEILGHLVDSASNNHQRFVRLQLANNLALPKYEQDGWVRVQRYQSTDWGELIELWRVYNLHLARVVRDAAPEVLGNLCRVGDGEPVTLQFLIEDYVVHVEHHLRELLK
jgi:hypothetical protein